MTGGHRTDKKRRGEILIKNAMVQPNRGEFELREGLMPQLDRIEAASARRFILVIKGEPDMVSLAGFELFR